MDDQGRSLVDSAPVQQLFAGGGLTEVGDGGEGEAYVQLTGVTLPETLQRAAVTLGAGIGSPECPPCQLPRQSGHPSTVAAYSTHLNTMQSKKFVRVVIWVVVIAMVLSLAAVGISLF